MAIEYHLANSVIQIDPFARLFDHFHIPITPDVTMDQSERILSLLDNLEVRLAAAFQAAISSASQSNPPPPPTQQQPNSLAKRKRNQKTRQQHKKAQAQRVTMQVQEVNHMQEVEQSYGQELEHLDVQIGVEKVSKHEAFVKSVVKSVAWIPTVATSWHAVIPYVGMVSFDGMIMVQNGVIWRPRMGVG